MVPQNWKSYIPWHNQGSFLNIYCPHTGLFFLVICDSWNYHKCQRRGWQGNIFWRSTSLGQFSCNGAHCRKNQHVSPTLCYGVWRHWHNKPCGRTLFGRCNWYFILDLEIDLPAQLGNFYNWCIRVVLAQLLSIEKSSVWIFCDDDDTRWDDHHEKLTTQARVHVASLCVFSSSPGWSEPCRLDQRCT